MRELHESTCDFIIGFYDRAQRYLSITFPLIAKGLLSYDDAVYNTRTELYTLYDQVYHLILPLARKIARFKSQIDIATEVSELVFFFSSILFKKKSCRIPLT